MTAEIRQFNDNLPNAPLPDNKFRLEYTYNLSGGLQSYKDPYGKQINYAQDKIGRLRSVTETSFGDVTTYANNPQYQAWGALKSLSYGDGTQMQMTYDNRLQTDTFQLINSGQAAIMQKNYDYYADGSLKYVGDELNPTFDRLNIYDHAGRIKEAKSAAEARGTPVTQNLSTELPYRQSYAFDAFGNMKQRNNTHWGATSSSPSQPLNLNYTFANNRITNAGWQHDADGRVTVSAAPDKSARSTYDAGGELTVIVRLANGTKRYQDGDGREGKRETGECASISPTEPCQFSSATVETRYYLRSSVLGKEVISEATFNGKKSKTFVLAAGATVARQEVYDFGGVENEAVYFQHEDVSGMSQRMVNASGVTYQDEDTDTSPVEADPLGGNAGISNPYSRPRPSSCLQHL